MEQSYGAIVFSVLYYTSLFALVLFLILVFVHLTITPIFALTADNPGIIVISGAGDRELSYTDDIYLPSSPNKRTPPGKTTRLPQCSYTIGFDIKKGTLAASQKKMAVLYRSTAQVLQRPFNYDDFKQTNILVSTKDAPDLITIELFEHDATIAKPIVQMNESITLTTSWQRVCIVLADTFAEVYVNGQIVSTIVVNNLKQVGSATDFFPPTNTSVVKISHMSMWPRILSPKEIRYYESKAMNPTP